MEDKLQKLEERIDDLETKLRVAEESFLFDSFKGASSASSTTIEGSSALRPADDHVAFVHNGKRVRIPVFNESRFI